MGDSIDQVIKNGLNGVQLSSEARPNSAVSHNPQLSPRRKQNTMYPQQESEFENENGEYALPVVSEGVVQNASRTPSSHRSAQSRGRDGGAKLGEGMMDFFGADVFQIVLHNPTTAHRFLRFCQSRACGENMEFLEKIDTYNRLLDEATKILSELHATYTSAESPRQINIPYPLIKQITSDIKITTQSTLPAMELIFAGAQEHVERLLASDIYPRFVKHQITTSATVALGDDKSRYQGLGDCFCVTDPSIADNPITFASDGFVEVTGYSRRDIVPRNCRFLQGPLTDKSTSKRLRQSIENAEETVELLLNYRKNGDPFWNLLYVSPLFDQNGNVALFLGGQINCSTTIHSCTDILRILSLNDEGVLERRGDFDALSYNSRPASERSLPGYPQPTVKTRSSFFKSFRSNRNPGINTNVRPEAGMEGELINKLGKLSFKTQVEAFYTAYSKYLVLKWNPTSLSLTISHFSPSSIDLLCLNLPNGAIAPIFNKDIFKILSEHAQSSSSLKALKTTVRENIKNGQAVSVEMGLLTGMGGKRGGFGGRADKRVEERYVGHWTPLKDEQGRPSFVVLTIAPK